MQLLRLDIAANPPAFAGGALWIQYKGPLSWVAEL